MKKEHFIHKSHKFIHLVQTYKIITLATEAQKNEKIKLNEIYGIFTFAYMMKRFNEF